MKSKDTDDVKKFYIKACLGKFVKGLAKKLEESQGKQQIAENEKELEIAKTELEHLQELKKYLLSIKAPMSPTGSKERTKRKKEKKQKSKRKSKKSKVEEKYEMQLGLKYINQEKLNPVYEKLYASLIRNDLAGIDSVTGKLPIGKQAFICSSIDFKNRGGVHLQSLFFPIYFNHPDTLKRILEISLQQY